MIARIITGVILILGAFVLPWWLISILSIAALFYFDNLYEVIFVGLILDYMYGTPDFGLNFTYVLTLVFFILFVFISTFKKRLIMY